MASASAACETSVRAKVERAPRRLMSSSVATSGSSSSLESGVWNELAAAGAGTGYLVGKQVQNDRREAYDAGYYDGHARDDRGDQDQYPMGRLTDRNGFVTSPYPPYNRIDVRGIPSGAQVEDPSTERIFINP